MTNQPDDEIESLIDIPIELPTEIPANPGETPVTIPVDDPEIIVRSENDYNNSLNALLKKYTPGS